MLRNRMTATRIETTGRWTRITRARTREEFSVRKYEKPKWKNSFRKNKKNPWRSPNNERDFSTTFRFYRNGQKNAAAAAAAAAVAAHHVAGTMINLRPRGPLYSVTILGRPAATSLRRSVHATSVIARAEGRRRRKTANSNARCWRLRPTNPAAAIRPARSRKTSCIPRFSSFFPPRFTRMSYVSFERSTPLLLIIKKRSEYEHISVAKTKIKIKIVIKKQPNPFSRRFSRLEYCDLREKTDNINQIHNQNCGTSLTIVVTTVNLLLKSKF